MYPSIQMGFSFLITRKKQSIKTKLTFFSKRVFTLGIAIGIGECLWNSRFCLSTDKYFVVISWQVLLAAIAFYHKEIYSLIIASTVNSKRMRSLLGFIHCDILPASLLDTHFLNEFHYLFFFLVSSLLDITYFDARIPIDLFSALTKTFFEVGAQIAKLN